MKQTVHGKFYDFRPGANLRSANLRDANLRSADLRGANLRDADLRRANLRGAILSGADLRDANLRSTDLSGTILRRADLRRADLRSANLRSANLLGANITDTVFPVFQIPQDGTLTVWKKASEGRLVKLLIPASSKRTGTPIGRKCRAEKAKVLDILSLTGLRCDTAFSLYSTSFIYTRGEYVQCIDYDDDIRIECTSGIHFFLTKEEARAY